MRLLKLLALPVFFLFYFILPTLASTADITGLVVSVLDGIDCPEKGQAYGNNAKHATSGLAFGKEVTLLTHGLDKYGRILADVLLPNGTNVNHELVKDGWCWWYRKYAPGDTVLAGLEKEARDAKKGVWQDRAPTPPWEYRKARRLRTEP